MMSEEFAKAGGFLGWGAIQIGTEKETTQPLKKTEDPTNEVQNGQSTSSK